MKNSEHHPKDIRTNNLGASRDVSGEISGNENKGEYFDSENGRLSAKGFIGSWSKIKGETIVHNEFFPGDWFNLVSAKVNNDIFEIWVEINGLDSPYIVVNNVVMGKSDDMPWIYEKRIQKDVNESCIGGEIFLTDYNTSPVIFSIKDIKDSYDAGLQTYFDDFNLNLYTVNLGAPLDIPIFTGLINLGGGGGLPVGSYQYSLRYVNESGDYTNWGPLTPQIPVLQSTSAASGQYPGIKSYGSPSNISAPTSYGINLRFRVTNTNNYDFIEIRRISYNTSAGLDVVPQGQIVARLDVQPGEISIREYLDPRDLNVEEGVLADNEEAGQLTAIEKAKAIRYYDKRLVLMNFETVSKDVSLDVLPYNGKKIFPVSYSMGKMGHNDPVNHTYRKNYQSGEKYSFAINVFDSLGGSAFVVEDDDLKNVQAPNRRDQMDTDSINLSTGGVVAATTGSLIEKTFEIFDTVNAVYKTDKNSFKNILDNGNKLSSTVNEFSPDSGNGSLVECSEIGYQPYRPTDSNDSTVSHNYVINPEVYTNGSNNVEYKPKGFACNYHTRGFAIGGVENLPSWAKSFSVVRSDRAGRVICQGIGMYSLVKGNFPFTSGGIQQYSATKKKDKLWFMSPDIESGVVSQDILDDIASNPQNYSVQFASPLGFFSEVYSFEENGLYSGAASRDRLADMVSYARILKDSGEINAGETSIGVSDYVAYNRYRNNNNPGQGAFNVPEGGNKIFPINGITPQFSGRSSYFEINFSENIYNVENTGGSGDNDFSDQGMRDFTEPFYIINIIQTGAQVQDLNLNDYYTTGHYQKIESIIGEGNGTVGQSFLLVDERWEDCVPALSPTDFNSSGNSFIYLQDEQNNQLICLNVTYKTGAQIASIINDINTNGFSLVGGKNVKGVYTHSGNISSGVYINFSTPYTIVPEGYKVIVRYDDSRPIVFFGGDSLIGENIFCPLDLESDGTLSDNDQQFDFNIGFPYRKFKLNPRHYVVRDTNGTNKIQNKDVVTLGYLRQLCVMYAAESITSTSLSFNGEYPLEFFPLTHYVMRPNRWKDSSFASGVVADIASDNNLYLDYFLDYPEEYTIWKYGGFRFTPQFNLDYSVKGPKLFFSKPKVGFKEQNVFCTGVAWSLPRAVNQQNSPGLKSFPALNRYYLDDDNGAIKKAWDAMSGGKGNNLYAICDSGIALLLTNKSVLSNLTADDLSITAVDVFISDEYWISKTIGSNSEMWRGIAEGSVEINTDSGKIEVDAIFIPNKDSVYQLYENTIKDILKDKYHSRMSNSLNFVADGFNNHVSAHYDKDHNEYWLQIRDAENQLKDRCFVYYQDTMYWIGRFHYSFDSYLLVNNESFGFRDGKMFRLNSGFIINNSSIIGFITQRTSVNLVEEKEFIAIEINTGPRGEMKPFEVSFMDEQENVLCVLNEATFGPSYLKQYSGWYNQIPRKQNGTRDRVQYRLILYKIKHIFEEEFRLVDSVIQYKTLK